jgi:hypothetical protein
VNLTKAEDRDPTNRFAKPIPVAMLVLPNVPLKSLTLRRTGEIASEIPKWKRISRPKEHIYSGSTEKGTEIAVTVLTTSPPKYVIFASQEGQPGYQTFVTDTTSPQAEIPERIINTAVINILRDRSLADA